MNAQAILKNTYYSHVCIANLKKRQLSKNGAEKKTHFKQIDFRSHENLISILKINPVFSQLKWNYFLNLAFLLQTILRLVFDLGQCDSQRDFGHVESVICFLHNMST